MSPIVAKVVLLLCACALLCMSAQGQSVSMGEAVPATKVNPLNMCQGRTSPDDWQAYNHGDDMCYVQVNVNTTACGFTSTPNYYTSIANYFATVLGSVTGDTTGSWGIADAKATSFTIYVNVDGDIPSSQPTCGEDSGDSAAQIARELRLYVNWLAISF